MRARIVFALLLTSLALSTVAAAGPVTLCRDYAQLSDHARQIFVEDALRVAGAPSQWSPLDFRFSLDRQCRIWPKHPLRQIMQSIAEVWVRNPDR